MAAAQVKIERQAIATLNAEAAASALVQSFQDYLVPITIDAAGFDARFRAEDVDPFASHVFRSGGDLVGIVLIARRGWASRIAAIAVAPPWRGRGVGQTLLRDAIHDARQRGDRRMLLEVIATNARAIALYERHGFVRTRQLFGFRRARCGNAAPELTNIDPIAVAQRMMRDPSCDLPWQIAAETLLKAVAPMRGLALGARAFAVVAPAKPGEVSLRALYVPPEHRRRHAARAMLDALFPDQIVATPVALPETLSPLFAHCEPIPISQYEMVLALDGY
jgi:ribosomal protein S18 acetylase RimI-like enzyme